ncbi:MAG: hypothetical protein NXH95_03225 [Pseudomonadaceae bacterium]|nr:hypothetical protein [Pseudomonadaceae bacterium]
METPKSAKESLQSARQHRKAGRYAQALEEYEWFFDNALSQRPSYYGVRLSYCLDEWHDIGKHYEPALHRLDAKRLDCFERFLDTGDAGLFHDFEAISKELGDVQGVVDRFQLLDEQHPKLASEAWFFAKQYFINKELWQICSKYLPEPHKECERLISKFFEGMKLYLEEPELFGNSDAQIVGWLVTDCHNLLRVLRHAGRNLEEGQAMEHIRLKLREEGYEKHISAVSAYF